MKNLNGRKKIDQYINFYFYLKMNISRATFLEIHKEYIIITFDTNQIFKATFYHCDHNDHCHHCDDTEYNIYNYYFTHNNTKFIFTEFDYYYDVEEFKCEIKRSAEKARQQMEQRSLNMILKRIVNEEFQWLQYY